MEKKRRLKASRKTGREADQALRNLHDKNEDAVHPLKPKRGRLTKTASRRRKARKKLLMFALISLLSITGIVATFVLVFRVDDFVVEGETQYSKNELVNMVPIEVDENIFMFDSALAEQAILDKYVYIETVDIRRKMPSTVVIEVTPVRERYTIETNGERYVISESLKTLRVANEDDIYCGIVGYNPVLPLVGEPISSEEEDRHNMLTLLLTELEKVGMLEKVVEINITDTLNMKFIYDGRVTVLLGSDYSMEYKMEMVSKVLSESIEGSETGTVDATVPGTVVFNAI